MSKKHQHHAHKKPHPADHSHAEHHSRQKTHPSEPTPHRTAHEIELEQQLERERHQHAQHERAQREAREAERHRELQRMRVQQLDRDIAHANVNYTRICSHLRDAKNHHYQLQKDIAREEGHEDSALITRPLENYPSFPKESVVLDILGVLFDYQLVIGSKETCLREAQAQNGSLQRELERQQQDNRALEKSLAELQAERQRVSNFQQHQQFVATLASDPGHASAIQLQALLPIAQPIARFENTPYKGIPAINDLTLPALALTQGHADIFTIAVNEKNYPLNQPQMGQNNPLELLRKDVQATQILPKIRSLDRGSIDFLVEKTCEELTTPGLNPTYVRTQIDLLVWILKNKSISAQHQHPLQRIALSYANSHFALTDAFFSNDIGNFSQLDAATRVGFLTAMLAQQTIDYQQLFKWYSTNRQFKINALYDDLKTLNRTEDALHIVDLAVDQKITFEQPQLEIFDLIIHQYRTQNAPLLGKIIQSQPDVVKKWFENESLHQHDKMTLICMAPTLFTPKQMLHTFQQQALTDDASVTREYENFTQKLPQNLHKDHLEPILFAFVKSRFDKTTSAEEVMQLAAKLEREWGTADFSTKNIEVVLKLAKNRILDLLSENKAQPSEELANFMAKHRIKRYLCTQYLPIPSTLWWTPSTRIYHQYKRAIEKKPANGWTGYQGGESERPGANTWLESEKNKAEQDVDDILHLNRPQR